MKGLRKYLSPFAPDQSGASAVLYELGGIIVICDAGGCAGNICGFDEPRWFTQKSAIFSAGLRDMDAILGRDEHLIAKLCDAAAKVAASFIAIIGTPVPAVIATDYKALQRMTEKRLSLPVVTIPTDGTALYDAGASAAYVELCKTFIPDSSRQLKAAAATAPFQEAAATAPAKSLGIWGATPLDMDTLQAGPELQAHFKQEGWSQVHCYGMGATLEELRQAGHNTLNLVLAPSGLAAAKYLKEHCGTPYTVNYPLIRSHWLPSARDVQGKKVLVVHQQVLANTLREQLYQLGAAQVTVASWFTLHPELQQPGDRHLTEEDQFTALVKDGAYELVCGDALFKRALPFYQGQFLAIPHFAVSGKM